MLELLPTIFNFEHDALNHNTQTPVVNICIFLINLFHFILSTIINAQ